MTADWPDLFEIGDSLTNHAALSWPALRFAPVNGRSTRPGERSDRAIGSIASRGKVLSGNSAVSIAGVDSRDDGTDVRWS